MSGPWFRRRYCFFFEPTDWRGWILLITTYAIAGLLMFVSETLEKSWPLVSVLSGGIAMLTLFSGFAYALWKTDWEYGRR